MKNHETEQEVGPGTDLDATENADMFQSKQEAKEADAAQRDDIQDEDIITLDSSD
ncbi:MAG TPA: hypothetical protein VLZ31_06905 [Microbacteriaceae bacterium]|nr:hypothetical protein [Microbacteriaceae bacterium]